MPDMASGWRGRRNLFDEVPALNVDNFDKDLGCVVLEKAGGTADPGSGEWTAVGADGAGTAGFR